MAIKVLLAEDHAIVREGLCALIKKQSDMEVFEAENGLEAVRQTKQLKPDVVVMDVSMPEINGIEATRQIKADVDNVKVLALSVHDEREYVMGMIRAGVSGYLLKDCVSAELVGAIRKVMKNESYLSPKIAAVVLNEHNADRSIPECSANAILKDYEIEVLKLLAEGKSAGEIAKQTSRNIKTIEAQRRRIMKKLEVDNCAALIKYAIREGLTSC
jgi:two-component system response regulator NreC